MADLKFPTASELKYVVMSWTVVTSAVLIVFAYPVWFAMTWRRTGNGSADASAKIFDRLVFVSSSTSPQYAMGSTKLEAVS
ncbi:hypothetical protein A5664_30010 [Mycolicibacterium fortuitum]|nr:hypothetical protein A5768_01455 [Mycolicibacterium fortuitum]OBI73435.1 hypothetical protein A5664_30010 [Mycolicibacterium fortuitum]